MALIEKTVEEDGNGDYTTLEACLNANEQDLVTGGDYFEAKICGTDLGGNGWGAADTTAVDIDGWTTGDGNHIRVYTTASARHDGKVSATAYRLAVASGIFNIEINESYTKIEGIQVLSSNTDVGCTGIRIAGWGTQDVEISNCVIDMNGGDGDGGYGSGIYIGSGFGSSIVSAYVWNCVVIDAPRGIQASIDTDITSYFYNCTVTGSTMGSADGFHLINAAPVYIYNCTVADCGTDFEETGGSNNTIDHCASDDGTGTNAQTLSGTRADDFNDFANDDFTIVSGSCQVGNGTDDPGSGLYSDDIIGTARSSTWDIGAFELAAVGLSIPVAMYHYRSQQ